MELLVGFYLTNIIENIIIGIPIGCLFTYVSVYANGNLWYASGNQNWGSVGMGRRWEGDSRRRGHVYLWLIHVDV